MGFIKDLLKIEERKMWKEVMSQLDPSQLDGMTKRDFLRPSTPEMKERVKFAKRCCQYVTSLPQNERFQKNLNPYGNNLTQVVSQYNFIKERLEKWDERSKDFIAMTSSSSPKTEEDYITLSYDARAKIDADWERYVKKKRIDDSDNIIRQSDEKYTSGVKRDLYGAERGLRDWTPSIDNATLNNANKQYRDKLQKTLDDAAKGIEAQDRHISGMEDLDNHSVHSSSVVRALNVMKGIDEEEEIRRQIQERAEQIRQQRENYGFNFDPSQQSSYNQQEYDDKPTNGRGR